jgi:hypothetical protein
LVVKQNEISVLAWLKREVEIQIKGQDGRREGEPRVNGFLWPCALSGLVPAAADTLLGLQHGSRNGKSHFKVVAQKRGLFIQHLSACASHLVPSTSWTICDCAWDSGYITRSCGFIANKFGSICIHTTSTSVAKMGRTHRHLDQSHQWPSLLRNLLG